MAATREQLIQGLRAADTAGNTADAQHFAEALRQSTPATTEESRHPPPEDPSATVGQHVVAAGGTAVDTVEQTSAGVLEGLAEMLGLPADILMGAAEMMAKPLGGGELPNAREGIKNLLEATGAQVGGEGRFGNIGNFLGAAALPSVGLFSKAAQANKFLSPIVNEAIGRPGALAITEAAGAIGGGTARTLTEGLDSPKTQMIAELLGSMGGSTILSAASGIRASLPHRRAAKIAQMSASNPEVAAVKLAEGPEDIGMFNPTSGQQSKDLGLLELEKSQIIKGGTAKARFKEQDLENRATLADAVRPTGEASPEPFFSERLSGIVKKVAAHAETAKLSAATALSKVEASISRAQANILAKKSIDDSLEQVTKEETRLWNLVDDTQMVSSAPLKEAHEQYVKNMTEADKSGGLVDLPAGLRKLVEAYPAQITAKEMQSFRSTVLTWQRKQDTNPKLYARLNDLQGSALKSMESAPGNAAFLDARAQTRAIKQVFDDDPVIGRILATRKSGEAKVHPELALEGMLVPGPNGGVNFQAYMRATGDTGPPIQFILNRYAASTTKQKFLNDYDSILSRMPAIKKGLQNAKNLNDVADLATKIAGGRVRHLETKTRVGIFLQKEPDKAIAAVYSSNKPRAGMAALVRSARKDRTGKALEGLRRFVVNDFLRRTIGQRATGEEITSAAFSRLLKERKDVLKIALSPEQMNRLNNVASAASKLELSASTSLRGGSDTAEKLAEMHLLGVGGRLVGARVGRIFGGGTVQIPGIVSGVFSKIARNIGKKETMNLLEEAIFNRKLMADFMRKDLTPIMLENRLNAHLLGIIPQSE